MWRKAGRGLENGSGAENYNMAAGRAKNRKWRQHRPEVGLHQRRDAKKRPKVGGGDPRTGSDVIKDRKWAYKNERELKTATRRIVSAAHRK